MRALLMIVAIAHGGPAASDELGAATRRNLDAIIANPRHLWKPAQSAARHAPRRDTHLERYGLGHVSQTPAGRTTDASR